MRITTRVLRFTVRILPVIFLMLCSLPVFAGEVRPTVNAGDTAWLLCSTAMVMLMTAPGLALFYGGLVSHRNILSTLMHSFFMICLISIQWVLLGYSLSFGTDSNGLIGGLNFVLFNGVGTEPISNGSVPHLAFAMYQKHVCCDHGRFDYRIICGADAFHFIHFVQSDVGNACL